MLTSMRRLRRRPNGVLPTGTANCIKMRKIQFTKKARQYAKIRASPHCWQIGGKSLSMVQMIPLQQGHQHRHQGHQHRHQAYRACPTATPRTSTSTAKVTKVMWHQDLQQRTRPTATARTQIPRAKVMKIKEKEKEKEKVMKIVEFLLACRNR